MTIINQSTINQSTSTTGQITGKRKALFIGINYFGQKGELRGCINDVNNIKAFLTSHYKIDEMRILTDDATEADKKPTRANIIAGFKWLRADVKPGDAMILHYSGHGGSVKDTDGDEEDGMDETLCPVDYATAGPIVDDEVHAVLVRGLPKVRMVHKGLQNSIVPSCSHRAYLSQCTPRLDEPKQQIQQFTQ